MSEKETNQLSKQLPGDMYASATAKSPAGGESALKPASSDTGAGFKGALPAGYYQNVSQKAKLILPTALWVLIVIAGLCFLSLLSSLNKTISTLDTLVEMEQANAKLMAARANSTKPLAHGCSSAGARCSHRAKKLASSKQKEADKALSSWLDVPSWASLEPRVRPTGIDSILDELFRGIPTPFKQAAGGSADSGLKEPISTGILITSSSSSSSSPGQTFSAGAPFPLGSFLPAGMLGGLDGLDGLAPSPPPSLAKDSKQGLQVNIDRLNIDLGDSAGRPKEAKRAPGAELLSGLVPVESERDYPVHEVIIPLMSEVSEVSEMNPVRKGRCRSCKPGRPASELASAFQASNKNMADLIQSLDEPRLIFSLEPATSPAKEPSNWLPGAKLGQPAQKSDGDNERLLASATKSLLGFPADSSLFKGPLISGPSSKLEDSPAEIVIFNGLGQGLSSASPGSSLEFSSTTDSHSKPAEERTPTTLKSLMDILFSPAPKPGSLASPAPFEIPVTTTTITTTSFTKSEQPSAKTKSGETTTDSPSFSSAEMTGVSSSSSAGKQKQTASKDGSPKGSHEDKDLDFQFHTFLPVSSSSADLFESSAPFTESLMRGPQDTAPKTTGLPQSVGTSQSTATPSRKAEESSSSITSSSFIPFINTTEEMTS